MTTPPELNTLQIDIDGELGTLTLNRPDAFNAMSPEMIEELMTAMAWLADEAPIRALIITGSGVAFCAGGDITWFRKGMEDPDIDIAANVRRGAEALHTAIVDLRRIEVPVVGAINGPAAGAGFSLALACDIRIAADGAFFAPAYGRIGASPDGGMTYFLPRVLGPAKALELLLDDPNLPATGALEMGIVGEVVTKEELMDRARERATELAKLAPHYVKMAKRLVGTSLEHSITEHLQLERHGIADSMATEDAQNGVVAFFGGEKPVFRGR
ncbi:MAG TPA: enoyl-CoA hydratase/isomerase family protein [Allosphingosinicella sp.]|nr:enoyl-CoA hydratase/isomerase family protein [Allosphingosinicella sp.]